jgi:hypothetical protein
MPLKMYHVWDFPTVSKVLQQQQQQHFVAQVHTEFVSSCIQTRLTQNV